MSARKRKDTGYRKRKHEIMLFGGLALEETVE
jgi:hypothetical protein